MRGHAHMISIEPINAEIRLNSPVEIDEAADYALIGALFQHAPELLDAIGEDHPLRAAIDTTRQRIESDILSRCRVGPRTLGR